MKKMAVIIALLVSGTSLGQGTVVAPTNTWFTMLNDIRFSKRWGISVETHERLGGILKDQGQFLFRPSLDFHLNDQMKFMVGYTFIDVQPYPPYDLPIARQENNLWEQVLVKYSVGKANFENRLRQENRWVQRIVYEDSAYRIDGTTYANRLRFRWTMRRDIVNFKNNRKLFFQGFDEIWINQNKNLMPVSFTRNWLYLGLGFAFNKKMNIQMGYMDQVDKVGAASYIRAPIIQTTFVWNFDLTKKP